MRFRILPLLCLSALLFAGCDLVRSIAGRPSAADLEKARLEILQREEAAQLARLDSLRIAEQMMVVNLEKQEAHLLDSLVQAKGTIVNSSKLGGLYTTKLQARYCIIVGAFRERRYAERKLAQCNAAGYTATMVNFRNGLNAIAVCPSDNLGDTYSKLLEMRGKDICPKTAWILMND